MSTLTRFNDLVAKGDSHVDQSTVASLYDDSEAIQPECLLGQWEAGSFNTGHPVHSLLDGLRFAGKEFHTVDDVNPVIVFDEAGTRVPATTYGKARLRQVVFRNVATASMIYDQLAIIDSFKRVSEDTVIGAMDARDYAADGPYFFYLTRLDSKKG